MDVQLIADADGKPQYAVIPYDDYLRMVLQTAEYDDENEENWESVDNEKDIYDDVGLPADVCSLMTYQQVSLQAAWRILRGLSQQEVADKLGISQSAVSQLEAVDSRPQKRTREKLAAIYGCTQNKSVSICLKRANSTSRRLWHHSERPDDRGKILRRSSATDRDG